VEQHGAGTRQQDRPAPHDPPPETVRRRVGTTGVFAVIGAAANATAIITFLAQAPDLALFCAALLPIGAGGYIFRRSWGRPARFRVLVAAASVAAGTFLLGHLAFPAAAAEPMSAGATSGPVPGAASVPSSAAVSAPPSGPSSAGVVVRPSTVDKTLFSGPVTLTAGTGVDVDGGPGTVVDTSGPNGVIDLFTADGSFVRVNGGDVYYDSGPPAAGRSRCERLARTQAQPGQGEGFDIIGFQYCFLTSAGHPALYRVNDTGTGSPYVVLSVTVWDS